MAADLTLLEALLLGVVQGITEWLPVSSSGHLVLAQQVFGIEGTVFLDLLLHVGTLVVILVFYRETVLDVLRALAEAPREHRDAGTLGSVWWADPRRRLALLVVVGSIPTAAIGFAFEGFFVSLFDSTLAVGIALLATGTWLFLARFAPAARQALPDAFDAVLVGIAQGAAIVPGVSRSGATITAALMRGVEREEAVRFSFLLSVPAIAGATLFQADPAAIDASLAAWPAYLVGVLAAVAVGYAALALLVRIVEDRGFSAFCWYCWALGGIVVALSLA